MRLLRGRAPRSPASDARGKNFVRASFRSPASSACRGRVPANRANLDHRTFSRIVSSSRPLSSGRSHTADPYVRELSRRRRVLRRPFLRLDPDPRTVAYASCTVYQDFGDDACSTISPPPISSALFDNARSQRPVAFGEKVVRCCVQFPLNGLFSQGFNFSVKYFEPWLGPKKR